MVAKLTLLHVILAVLACGSLYLAWREVQRRYISQWRLLAPPALGLGAALGLALIQIVLARQPGWTFLLALAVGLLAGGLRGALMRVEHDFYRPMVAVSLRARFVLLWVAVMVAAAVAVEIVGARAAPAADGRPLCRGAAGHGRCGGDAGSGDRARGPAQPALCRYPQIGRRAPCATTLAPIASAVVPGDAAMVGASCRWMPVQRAAGSGNEH